MSIVQELRRRNVFRVAAAYVVAAWAIIEVSSLILDIYESPDTVIRIIVALLALGLPFAVLFAWAFEITPDGIKRESEVSRSDSSRRHTARRLDIVTIGLVAVAAGLFWASRFVPANVGDATERMASSVVSPRALEPLAQQILKLGRLRDSGRYGEAFELAREIGPLLGDEVSKEEFWAEFSWSADIETDPPGAMVSRQLMRSGNDVWEELGVTPLKGVRFAEGEGYRIRIEKDGYRTVDLLQAAIRGVARMGVGPLKPVRLDATGELPADMVRIPGFTYDLVDFADFFMDRFEVTNRQYQDFVSAGGYETAEYWTEPFIKGGAEIAWREAVSTFVDQTGRPGPAMWAGGAYPHELGDHPVTGISWFEASAYANFVNKTLPAAAHYRSAVRFFGEDSWLVAPRSNLSGTALRRVGEKNAGNTLGVYDVIGNAREWLSNSSAPDTRATTGGAWTDAPFLVGWITPTSSWDRDQATGFRLIRSFDSAEKLARLRVPEKIEDFRDYRAETPVPDAEFAVYRRLYAYDSLPLNAALVETAEFEHWTRQRVDFDLPYGERGGTYLYIPRAGKPPFEAILLWSGSQVLDAKSADEDYVPAFDFIVRSGRIVAQPVLKGAFDRDDEEFSTTHGSLLEGPRTMYRDYQIKWIQDVSRTIDYLQTRDDVQSDRIGYYGFSFGAMVGPIMLAIDERIRASVLNVGGFDTGTYWLPEIDPFNFAPRVRSPVVMLNGEYDVVFPLETSQKPMFDLLGTDAAHKAHFVTKGGHIVPRSFLISETLDWFDRYLSESN